MESLSTWENYSYLFFVKYFLFSYFSKSIMEDRSKLYLENYLLSMTYYIPYHISKSIYLIFSVYIVWNVDDLRFLILKNSILINKKSINNILWSTYILIFFYSYFAPSAIITCFFSRSLHFNFYFVWFYYKILIFLVLNNFLYFSFFFEKVNLNTIFKMLM